MAEKTLWQRLGEFMAGRATDPPTIEAVDAQLAAVSAERASITGRMAAIEGNYTDDNTAEYVALGLKLKQSDAALRDLQAERFQASRRAYLADYEQNCAADQQHAQRCAELKPMIAAKQAELAELAREYAAEKHERDLLANQRLFGRTSLSDELKRSITELERKRIEHRYGIANAEELAGAQRQAAGIVTTNPRIEQLQAYHDSLKQPPRQ